MKSFILILILILITSLFTVSTLFFREHQNRKRLSANQSVLLGDVKRYKTKDSLNVLSSQALNLSLSEFKKFNSRQAQEIKDLNLKLKRVQSYQHTATITNTKIETHIVDSIIYRDRFTKTPDTLKCISFTDGFTTLNGCFDKENNFTGLVLNRDTLQQIVHRIPRKFLFIKWGTKSIAQEIYSRNPNSEIVYNKVINIRK